jgi:hypothetical protein
VQPFLVIVIDKSHVLVWELDFHLLDVLGSDLLHLWPFAIDDLSLCILRIVSDSKAVVGLRHEVSDDALVSFPIVNLLELFFFLLGLQSYSILKDEFFKWLCFLIFNFPTDLNTVWSWVSWGELLIDSSIFILRAI